MSKKISFLGSDSIEILYSFIDNSNRINASIFNTCEYELTGILREISKKLKVNTDIEIEPLTGNDFRCRYYFTPIKNVTDIYAQSIKYAVLASLFIDIITSPLSVSIDNVLKNCIAALSEDKEIKKLKSLYEKGKSATDIESLEIEIKRNIRNIDEYIICKKRSNFYEILRPYRKVKSISVAAINENNERVSEITISKNDFKTFILTTDDLDPENNENAVIEIVAPVLKNSNYNKWVGVYDGELINFYMGSDEFRTMVQKGKVEFKNGTSIICHLRTSKRMNHEGEVKITRYDVVLVNKYFDNHKPIETIEGRNKRKKAEADNLQLKFDY